MKSVNHNSKGEKFGDETKATFFLTKKKERNYHIDYMLSRNSGTLDIGNYEDWIKHSDHMPLGIDFSEIKKVWTKGTS